MMREQARKRDRTQLKIIIGLAVILSVHTVATTVRGNTRQEAAAEARKEALRQQKTAEDAFLIEETRNTHERGNLTESEAIAEDRFAVFDTMSADWGAEVYEDGFVYYQIPEEYTVTGGYFPEKMQVYTFCLCQQYGIRYSLIVAMIEHESGYKFDSIGDDGLSEGYMQITRKWHSDRMEELNCGDLMNPYQNVRVGIDWMAELIDRYGTIQDALTAYNYGERGARENMWGKGIYVNDYNSQIMSRMKEIEEEMKSAETD